MNTISTIDRYITPKNLIQARFKEGKKIPKWKAAVICFRDTTGSSLMVEKANAIPIGYKVLYGLEESTSLPHVYQSTLFGMDYGIITRCVWGGPQAAIIVEELAEMGVKYIIGFGAAGSIDERFQQGSQIVISRALITDGTSRHYGESFAEPNHELCNLLDMAIQKVHAATTDALYRETPKLVNEWIDNGAHVINMEAAPFYASSKKCGVNSIWIGHVSDVLIGKWVDWHIDRTQMTIESITNCLCLLTKIAKK